MCAAEALTASLSAAQEEVAALREQTHTLTARCGEVEEQDAARQRRMKVVQVCPSASVCVCVPSSSCAPVFVFVRAWYACVCVCKCVFVCTGEGLNILG